ncbi:MAG: hypothetical protein DI539_28390, partial [Flavobacterium psychrophilum]
NQNIGDLCVAFPNEYAGERSAPFYFQNVEYENIFQEKEAKSKQKKLLSSNFYQSDDGFVFERKRQSIPTEKQSLTYYTLYLPLYAVPTNIQVTDTLPPGKQFTKNVFRDDQTNRYIVYIKCSSRYGLFNFNIFCRFHLDQQNFKASVYADDKTIDFDTPSDHLRGMISPNAVELVEQFFTTNNHNYNIMNKHYHINQAQNVGDHIVALNNTLTQQNNALPANTNYEQLADELSRLRALLEGKASTPAHHAAIEEVKQAEESAKSKDGNKVVRSLVSAGKWVLDAAKDITTDVLAEVIKKQM